MRFALSAVLLATVAGSANAQTFTLQDGNSSSVFSANAGGQVNWVVDGVSQLFNQRFYYRSSLMNDEVPVDSLTLTGSQLTDTNTFDDARNDTLALRYNDTAGLEFRISYLLRGSNAGSGTADLAETIRISNPTNAAISVSFFQYVDFDLSATAGGDFAEIVNANTVRQWDPSGNFTVAETVVTPGPSAYQVGNFPSIVSLFGNGVADNLNNAGGLIGPTDATWSFQWNFTLAPGGSFTISKDKLITIPSPAGLAVLGLAGIAATRRRRA
jgi:hypothetical protein